MNTYAVRSSVKWVDLYKSNKPLKVKITTVTRVISEYSSYTIQAVKCTGTYTQTVRYQRCGLRMTVGEAKKVSDKWVKGIQHV